MKLIILIAVSLIFAYILGAATVVALISYLPPAWLDAIVSHIPTPP